MVCVKRAPSIVCLKALRVRAECTCHFALHGMLEQAPGIIGRGKSEGCLRAGSGPHLELTECPVQDGKRSCRQAALLSRQVTAAHAGDPVTRRCHSCGTLVSSQAFHRKDAFTSFVVGESVLGWPKAYAALKEACALHPVQSMTRRPLPYLTLSDRHRTMTTWPMYPTEA